MYMLSAGPVPLVFCCFVNPFLLGRYELASRTSVGPGGQQDQEHGVVLHDWEEGYQPPQTSRTESSQVPQGLSMTPLPTQVDRWTVRSRTWGSSTCSGRR